MLEMALASFACRTGAELLVLAREKVLKKEHEERLQLMPRSKLYDSELSPAKPVPPARLTVHKSFESHLVGHHQQTRLPRWNDPAMSLVDCQAPGLSRSFTEMGNPCPGARPSTTGKRV